VLEFMDKGVKGLLSGDMSAMILMEIQQSIEKYNRNFTKLTLKMNDLIDKERVVDAQVALNFQKQIDSVSDGSLAGPNGLNIYERNLPKYSSILQDFQQFMINVDRKQWRRFIQLDENNQYISKSSPQGKSRVIIDS